jgi:transglutaminase-like putative cysteine protease
MRLLLLLLVFVLAPCAAAQQEPHDLFASKDLQVDVTISSDLAVVPRGASASADYVQADLSFFPRDDAAQKVLSLVTRPEAEHRQGALRYRWETPRLGGLRYEAKGKVVVSNLFPRVTEKISFPLTSIPSEAQYYLAPTEHIDSDNQAIVNLANKLAQGKDDLFIVVSDIATWTKNTIKYNLSTLTAEVSQKASWVLQHKEGVCDELTSLFIALLRALGIPARFVSGASYTTSPLFPQKWSAHGWAEVYFPSVGWVPFDPTFGEFGWVDPGHVKIMTSTDPAEPSVRLEWRGTNIGLEYREPGITATITSIGERLPSALELTITPLYEETGFGAYNLVEASVENLRDYYVAVELKLARVKELEVLEPHEQQVVLRPHEKKSVFWRVRVLPELREGFVYTIPLGVFTVTNDSVISSFTARAQGAQHTKQEVTRAMNVLAGEQENVAVQELGLRCSADSAVLYPGEIATVQCSLRNLGTAPLQGVRTCIDGQQCVALDLGIAQSRAVKFTQQFTAPGTLTALVQASTAGITRSTPVPFVMQDIPAVNITGFDYPAMIAYDKLFLLVFTLSPASHSTPKNVKLTVRTPGRTRAFEIPFLSSAQTFDIEMQSAELSLGTTDIAIESLYEDERGHSYTTRTTAPITLTDVPFWSKVWLWFRAWF